MATTRTQIYLTKEQRTKLDALGKREHKTLAELIREAVDRYLGEPPNRDEVLRRTFGIAPDFELPDRSEWNRSFE